MGLDAVRYISMLGGADVLSLRESRGTSNFRRSCCFDINGRFWWITSLPQHCWVAAKLSMPARPKQVKQATRAFIVDKRRLWFSPRDPMRLA